MKKHEIAKGEIFRVGEVWESPKGNLYKVIAVRLRQATLRMGKDGCGRIVRRQLDAVIGWSMSKEHNHG
ncbi:hypothetical protein JBO39_01560 [Serratia marcescens]|uniref:hypothetical protein n=1 Tax=Serratia marcescens TaxID=615 RepID=UPI00192C61B2|nr:hypothetical protein [Serratia marcescens]MBL5819901.1 hypothetical protein [Serratia marcescens]